MQDKVTKLAQVMVLALIFIWLAWRLAVPVDFIQSDLGRHIKNGELILHGHWEVLYKNYYSYTNPQFSFVNHHWLFGVFCFCLWHYFGFGGLSFVYLLLELFTFYVFFRCYRTSSFLLACAFALLSLPLVSFRSEVRPEGLSYLFCGIFWLMIDFFQHKRIKPDHLIVGLCLLQVIWVNTHLLFVMGPLLTAIFWWQAYINKEEGQVKILQKLFIFLCLACFINPSGFNGILEPFFVMKEYAYSIESQPVIDLLNSNITYLKPILMYFLAAMTLLGIGLFFLIKQEGYKKNIFFWFLALILSLEGLKAMRMIGLFAFFWLPLSMAVYDSLLKFKPVKFRKSVEIFLVVLGIACASVNFDWRRPPFLGISPGSNEPAEFFKSKKIAGAIFNNYDIGGYLIYHLSSQYKLFVDDRGTDAFPDDFFLKTYVPMQTNDAIWQEMDKKYRFNVIFFSHDTTPWGFEFIKNRFADPSWALVYDNNRALILLKRNVQNAPIIRQNEIKVVYVPAVIN